MLVFRESAFGLGAMAPKHAKATQPKGTVATAVAKRKKVSVAEGSVPEPRPLRETKQKQIESVNEEAAGQLFPDERDRRSAPSSSATASSSVPQRATSVDGIDEVSFRDIRDYGVVVPVGTEVRAGASDLRSVVNKGVIEVDLTDDTYIADSRSHTRTSPYTSPHIGTIYTPLAAELHGSWSGGGNKSATAKHSPRD